MTFRAAELEGDGAVEEAEIGIARTGVIEAVWVAIFERGGEPHRRGHRTGVAHEIASEVDRPGFKAADVSGVGVRGHAGINRVGRRSQPCSAA